MEKVDRLDKKILGILSQNARMPFKDVAAQCGVSRAAIHQRVQHLVENGVITGSGFDVNPKSLGYTTCTYVGLNLERGSMYKKVVERISAIQEVVECHFTTGPYTMLVKLYAKDNEQLMDLLNNQLQGIPGVVSTETSSRSSRASSVKSLSQRTCSDSHTASANDRTIIQSLSECNTIYSRISTRCMRPSPKQSSSP